MQCLRCIQHAMFEVYAVQSGHLHDPPGHQLAVHGHGAPLLQRSDPEGADRDHLHSGQAGVIPGHAIPLAELFLAFKTSNYPTIRLTNEPKILCKYNIQLKQIQYPVKINTISSIDKYNIQLRKIQHG